MNKATKDMLKKAIGMLEDSKNIISSIAEQTHTAFDDMSEKAQEGDKGQKLNETADTLDEHDGALDDIINALNDMINEE